jgi:diketogulonate reductase-like aldo/keto reductase
VLRRQRVAEQLEGGVRYLGVSNVSLEQLRGFCEGAEIAPAFVQNRCFARLGWDAGVREICDREGIAYQAFSLLTANPEVLGHPATQHIARRHGRSVPQVIFRFALALGMIPLTGTTDPGHMREDLEVYDFELTEEETSRLESAGE